MILGDASRAHQLQVARQSRIIDSIDALHAFYRMPKCLEETFFPEFHSDLICIRTLTTFFFFFFKGERIQISL